MAERTGIKWCDHTHNFWIGCDSVSPACARCYARSLVNGRMGGNFDERRRTVSSNWMKPLAWNRAAKRDGVRRRVFSLSLGDFFDNQVPPEWRADAWDTIRACDSLDWLLLTKRPMNISKMLPPDWKLRADGTWQPGYPNVWLGTTVENQDEAARRIPHLLGVKAAVHFLSCEPLLEPVNLTRIEMPGGQLILDALTGFYTFTGSGGIKAYADALARVPEPAGQKVDWVIVGGESGGGARPMMRRWAESVIVRCQDAGVPVFMKQTGSKRVRDPDFPLDWPAGITGSGTDPAQWPESVRVQQWPQGAAT